MSTASENSLAFDQFFRKQDSISVSVYIPSKLFKMFDIHKKCFTHDPVIVVILSAVYEQLQAS